MIENNLKTNGTNAGPRILILIPVSNEEKFINRCLNSVIAQDFQSWTIHLNDNASDDATLEIARKATLKEKRIKISSNKSKLSAAENWNKLAKDLDSNSHFDYVMWLAGDDYLLEQDYLSNILNVGDAKPELDLILPIFKNCDEKGFINENHTFQSDLTSGGSLKKCIKLGLEWSNAAVIYGVYRRAAFCNLIQSKTARVSNEVESDWWWAFQVATELQSATCPQSTYIKTIKMNPYYVVSGTQVILETKNRLQKLILRIGKTTPVKLTRQLLKNERVNKSNFLYAILAICVHSAAYSYKIMKGPK